MTISGKGCNPDRLGNHAVRSMVRPESAEADGRHSGACIEDTLRNRGRIHCFYMVLQMCARSLHFRTPHWPVIDDFNVYKPTAAALGCQVAEKKGGKRTHRYCWIEMLG